MYFEDSIKMTKQYINLSSSQQILDGTKKLSKLQDSLQKENIKRDENSDL